MASAPCRRTSSSGPSTLPFDFDIFTPPSCTQPWWKTWRTARGSRRGPSRSSPSRRSASRGGGPSSGRCRRCTARSGTRSRRRRGRTARRPSAVDVAQEVPQEESTNVSIVRLARALLAALRARHVQPLRVGGERRHALRPVVLDLGQQHRQLVFRHGDDAAVVAVDDRDRGAPVALPREAPVAEAIRDRGLGLPVLPQGVDDRGLASSAGRPSNSPKKRARRPRSRLRRSAARTPPRTRGRARRAPARP